MHEQCASIHLIAAPQLVRCFVGNLEDPQLFGLRALFGDGLMRRNGGGCHGDASAAMLNECYERPSQMQAQRGCEPQGFCYSATPRHAPYFASGHGGFGGGGGFLMRMLGRIFGGRGFGGGGGFRQRFDGGGGGGGFDDSGFEEDNNRDFGRRNDRSDFGRRDDRSDFGRRNDRSDFGRRDDRSDFGRRDDRSSNNRSDDRRDSRHEQDSREADRQHAKSLSDFEAEALRLINNYRRKNGLSAVDVDPRLQHIATVHSEYQDAHGIGHKEARRGWETPGRRMNQVGLSGWAENSAYGQMTAQQLVRMWIRSDGHRRALLDPNVKIAGLSQVGKGVTLDLV